MTATKQRPKHEAVAKCPVDGSVLHAKGDTLAEVMEQWDAWHLEHAHTEHRDHIEGAR